MSALRGFGWGVIDNDGDSHPGHGVFLSSENTEEVCDALNEPIVGLPPLAGAPFRSVELFYKVD
jgi:hypothetical protein